MKVERINAYALDKAQAKTYAMAAVREKLGKSAFKAKYLGGGSFGRAVSVTCADGSELVVKFLRAPHMMEKEAHDLRLIAKYCTVRVPAVLFTRAADDSIPVDCYGMEKIAGKSALFALGMLLLGKKRRLAFADRVTEAIHAVHSCTNDRFGDTMPCARRGQSSTSYSPKR